MQRCISPDLMTYESILIHFCTACSLTGVVRWRPVNPWVYCSSHLTRPETTNCWRDAEEDCWSHSPPDTSSRTRMRVSIRYAQLNITKALWLLNLTFRCVMFNTDAGDALQGSSAQLQRVCLIDGSFFFFTVELTHVRLLSMNNTVSDHISCWRLWLQHAAGWMLSGVANGDGRAKAKPKLRRAAERVWKIHRWASQFAYLYYALKVCTLFVKTKYILLSM